MSETRGYWYFCQNVICIRHGDRSEKARRELLDTFCAKTGRRENCIHRNTLRRWILVAQFISGLFQAIDAIQNKGFDTDKENVK